jgi:hypothetical protein
MRHITARLVEFLRDELSLLDAAFENYFPIEGDEPSVVDAAFTACCYIAEGSTASIDSNHPAPCNQSDSSHEHRLHYLHLMWAWVTDLVGKAWKPPGLSRLTRPP